MLEKYLTADFIQLKQHATDWRDAIEIAAAPLLSKKLIEKEYVAAMQQAVLDFGPYMVLANGFALAHAQPGALVHEVCISLVTIAEPVDFGNKDFDPIDILIAFGTPDAESHIGMLRDLAGMLNQPGNFEIIRNAKEKQIILSLFSASNQ